MDYLITDGNNHAFMGASVAMNIAKDGNFEDVLYNILTGMVQKIKKTFKGYKCFVCWDSYGGTHFRKELYPEYKATRNPSWIDFKAVENCKSIYELYGITSITLPQCEGDDAIYALAKELSAKDEDSHIVLFSRDKDLIQVVQAGYADEVYDPHRKSMMTIPNYPVVMLKALAGDSSDNILGVKGIGEKTAIKVINGEKALTESQKAEFERCLKVIDASLNPNLANNCEEIKKYIYN